jgi:hypothetical protein
LVLFQIPSIQNYTKEKLVTYIEGKIKTKVVINKVALGFPKKIILEGIYFEDQKKDTLLAGKKLVFDIGLFQLIDNNFQINSAQLEGVSAKIKRNKKAEFNYDYIIKAFSSPKNPKVNSPPMQFSIEEINLDQVKLSYTDAVSNNDLSINLNHLDTRFETFDLDKTNFEIPKITIEGLKTRLKQGLIPKSNATVAIKKKTESILKLKLGEINLSKSDFSYQSEENKIVAAFYLKKLLVKIEKIDIYNQFALVKSIDLSGVKGGLSFGKLDQPKKESTLASANNWEVKITKTAFKEVGFQYDNNTKIAIPKGIDYNHLHIKHLNLQADNLKYNPGNVSGNVNSLSVKEQSGLNIQSFKAAVFYGKKYAYLKKLYLKTPQTELKDEIRIGYPSIESLAKNPGELSLTAYLKKSKLAVNDLLLFAPTLLNTNPFRSNPNAILLINGTIKGKIKSIEFPFLEISGIGSTKVAANGRILGFPDIKKAYFDLNIKNLQSGSKDFVGIVPPKTIPDSIQLPSKFSAKGIFKGTTNHFYTDLNLVSNFGNAKIKATFDQRIKNQEKYDAQTELDNFDLGKLIKNDTLGKITLKATIKGTGFNPKTATATLNGTVLKAYYKKYKYQKLNLKGSISNGSFQATASVNDPNLTFDLVSNGSFKDKYPTGKLKLNVDIADLEKLNLHAGPMKIRGVIDANIQSAKLDYLNGEVSAHSISIANAKEQFELDSITVKATSTTEKNSLILKSQFLNAEIIGKYKLTKIAAALSNSFAKYYAIKPNSKKIAAEKQQFKFKMDVKDNPLLLKFIPKLKSMEPISVNGNYNSEHDSIILNGSIPKLIYGEYTITNAVLKVDTKDEALVYNLEIDDVQNSQFQIPFTAIYGKVQNNTVDYTLQLKDLNNKEKYLIAGTLKTAKVGSEINIDPKNVLLNYEPWKIAPTNLIRFGKNGIYINDFEWSQNGNSIRMQSQSEKPNAPIAIDFVNFNLITLTNILQKGDLEANGKINGNVLLKNTTSNPVFTSDLTVEDFRFKKDTIGTINIKINNEIEANYNTKISITGQDNTVHLDGIYKATDSSFDMNLNIEKLNLKSIQGFTMDQLSESTGFLSGNFKINGNTTQPNLVGELKFNDVGFKAKQLNSNFKSINDKILFTTNTITFDHFNIKDEKDNDLSINGKIESSDFSNLGFDLTLDADNFKAVNSKAKDNDLYYGELYLDNHLRVKGNWSDPIIDGNIKVNKETRFTVVIPQSDPSIADREGIVEFIDQDRKPLISTIVVDTISSKTGIKGVDASVNIEIDKEAEISVIIDKANGDYLKLKGEAQLNGGIDSSGKKTLTGRYELSEGSYEMNFSAIKRKFDIKKGSYLLWTGEPTKADINITATYKTEAAPIDLINDQLGNLTTEVRNTYKQKIPFETELIMKGELMKPVISFDIVLPEGNNSVSTEIINATQAKLTQLRDQPDELNKQVFALLLLNRFIGENPLASESGGTSISTLARESASKILSQQLDNLAGNIIKGVDINFDLNSSQDYTTGQLENKTDLGVGISKKLLNDRLKVTVGSNFGIEGPQQVNQNPNNIAGDVSIDYQLSKNGRYKVRVYRINNYQVALQGEVVETGIAFSITIDYNTFKELYRKDKEQKAKEQLKKKSNE